MAGQPPEQVPRTAPGSATGPPLDLRWHLRSAPQQQEDDDRDDVQDLEHDERIDPVTHPREPETPDQLCRHCGEPIVSDGAGGWTHPRGPGSSLIRCQPPAPYGTDATP